MKLIETPLPGVLVVEPEVFGDSRGYFFEAYNWAKYQQQGFTDRFVQDNVSLSTRKGILRGLHFQWPNPQGKLVSALRGEIFDVAVDIREGSPTFGQWHAVILSEENHRMLFVPKGFAHGFCTLSEEALVTYKCTDFFSKEDDGGIHYLDPTLAIEWPLDDVFLSEKDQNLPLLNDLPPHKRPQYFGE
mgnify:FL=1